MADEFALIDFTVPGSIGTQDYTDPAITDWSLAIIVISGNISDETEGGRMNVTFLNKDGTLTSLANRVLDGPASSDCGHEANTADINIVDDDPFVHGGGMWAIAQFSADLGTGFRLNWTNVSGVAGRSFKGFIILLGGLTSHNVGTISPSAGVGFEADAALALSYVANVGSSLQNDACLGLGAVINDGIGDEQYSVAFAWERFQDPTRGLAAANTDDYASSILNSITNRRFNANTFDSAGYDETLTTGSPNRTWMAMVFSEVRDAAPALENLDGSTGSQAFTGLGLRPKIVLGMIVGCASDDTIESGSDEATTVVFATDGTNTYSISISQRAQALGTNEGHSRFTDGSINMLSHLGGTDFVATVTSLDTTGITLNVTTGFTGRMFLWAIEDLGLGPQAHDEDEEIVEEVAALLTRLHAVSEDVEVSEEVGQLVEDADFLDTATTTGDTASGGSEKGETAYGGSEMGGDGNRHGVL